MQNTIRLLLVTATCFVAHSIATAATITECQEMLRTGEYKKCLEATSEAIERRSYGEEWPMLKASAEIQLGLYSDAQETIEAGITRYSWSIRLRMLSHQNCRILGDSEKAEELIDEINRLATSTPWRYTDADDLVALGQAAIVLGADPKDVLEGFFDRARKNYQSRPDGYLAAGELAIEKGDFQLAAEILRPAGEKFPDNPKICFALATAIRSVEPERAAALMEKSLTINPSFLPTLQKLAERQIDSEDYELAAATIEKIHAVNPAHPEAHALQAVIHHLNGESELEAKSRSAALENSTANPAVDYLIGEKLSRKYRFKEGAEYQRKSLEKDAAFLPAKTQLAQDLLRLGEEETGWLLAEQAREQDKYNTTLFNLLQLKDSLNRFTERKTDRFVIRMHKSESAVYGDRVEALLTEAFDTLSTRYGYVPDEPIVVEIFDRPDDFAVRTFGIPDVAGFLGVCFGKLITANSPSSQRDNPTNWESVLWHEFCHVITLQMTGNKIPRWLSEGISVYEERERDKRWGQSMDAASRRRILSGDVTPVSRLSSAFLNADSGDDLNFAYFESSMVVEFIIKEHGFESLTATLGDLNAGLTINDALDRHAGGLEALDNAFDQYLKKQAEQFAPDVRFFVEHEDGQQPPNLLQIAEEDPNHYTAGLRLAAQYLRSGDLEAAEERLLQLVSLYPQDSSSGGARPMLAAVYERQQRTEEQTAVLSEHLNHSGDDLAAALTLLTLYVEAENWEAAHSVGELVRAINPLHPTALRLMYQSASATENNEAALSALHGLLELDPADAARTHFRIASLHFSTNRTLARKHVLLALEQAPRYRDAHQLLLQISDSTENLEAVE